MCNTPRYTLLKRSCWLIIQIQIKKDHPEFQLLRGPLTLPETSATQSSIASFAPTQLTKYPAEHLQQVAVTEMLGTTITTDLLPLFLIDSPGFMPWLLLETLATLFPAVSTSPTPCMLKAKTCSWPALSHFWGMHPMSVSHWTCGVPDRWRASSDLQAFRGQWYPAPSDDCLQSLLWPSQR